MVEKTVIWDDLAEVQFQERIEYIKSESVQQAEKVKAEILQQTAQLSSFPERYPKDKYRKNNNGSYRAFEIYRFRISYRITEKHIRIIRIRSTDQSPKNY